VSISWPPLLLSGSPSPGAIPRRAGMAGFRVALIVRWTMGWPLIVRWTMGRGRNAAARASVPGKEKAPTEGCLVGALRWRVDREAYPLILFRRQSPDKAIFWAEPTQL
jgi:hypothetical protein